MTKTQISTVTTTKGVRFPTIETHADQAGVDASQMSLSTALNAIAMFFTDNQERVSSRDGNVYVTNRLAFTLEATLRDICQSTHRQLERAEQRIADLYAELNRAAELERSCKGAAAPTIRRTLDYLQNTGKQRDAVEKLHEEAVLVFEQHVGKKWFPYRAPSETEQPASEDVLAQAEALLKSRK